jgi:hypothetical protein
MTSISFDMIMLFPLVLLHFLALIIFFTQIWFGECNEFNERLKLFFLCSSAVNSQRLVCSQKGGVKCSY